MKTYKKISRRTFIGTTATVVTIAMSQSVAGSQHEINSAPAIPIISFGEHKISRLIVGGNPVSGTSHFSKEMDQEMLHYFTAENTKKLLKQCESNGVNTWQSRGDWHIRRLLLEYRDEGGNIQWIAQTASEFSSFKGNIRSIAAMNPIGIYHHGSRTDKYWNNGEIDKIQDDLKVIRDSGVRVGIASHIPKVLEYIEERNWDVDFYMACFYNIKRNNDGKDAFLAEDRETMCRFIQSTPKQCIAFKILAASRNSKTPEELRKAFEFAFQHIKPIDIVNVGMFPKYSDQVTENVQIVSDIFL